MYLRRTQCSILSIWSNALTLPPPPPPPRPRRRYILWTLFKRKQTPSDKFSSTEQLQLLHYSYFLVLLLFFSIALCFSKNFCISFVVADRLIDAIAIPNSSQRKKSNKKIIWEEQNNKNNVSYELLRRIKSVDKFIKMEIFANAHSLTHAHRSALDRMYNGKRWHATYVIHLYVLCRLK